VPKAATETRRPAKEDFRPLAAGPRYLRRRRRSGARPAEADFRLLAAELKYLGLGT
jgi:hypothetical protein